MAAPQMGNGGPKPRPGETVEARVFLAVAAASVILAVAIMYIGFRDVTRALEFYKSTIIVNQSAADLQVLAFESILAPRPDLEAQWPARHAQLAVTMSNLREPSQEGLIEEIRMEHSRLGTHFPGFVLREKDAIAGYIAASRRLQSGAFQLTNRSHALIETYLRRRAWFALLFVVVLGTVVTESWRRGTRRFHAAQARLIESREEFQAVVTTASDAIVSADSHGRITLFNRAAELMFGYDAREAIGQPLTLLMPERFKSLHHAGLHRFLETGESRIIGKTVEVIGRHREAAEFPMEISIADWSISGQVYFTAILRDVTAHRASVEALRKVNEELESFSYTVSHDLRAPLRHIAGYTGLVRERYATALDEEGRRYLLQVSQAVGQMGRLIDDLLAFSKMGRAELYHEEVDMRGLVEQALTDLEEETQGRRITWDIQSLAPARGDKAMLRQVWVNLLSNAIKYSRAREEARITIGSAGKNATMEEYFVRDNGVGFDMAHAGKLFEVFQRLHGPGDFEGTGVGLANVKRIVARHGGDVSAHAISGEGATFCFSLPRSSEASERGSD